MKKDKFEARNLKKICNFNYHSCNYEFPADKVTSAGVVTFDDLGRILVVELKRGFDIPGGHIQKGDISFEDAVMREALEEAYVLIKDIKLSLVVESDYFGNTPDKITYMLFYSAKVDRLNEFIINNESSSRKFMFPEDFIEIFNGDKQLISEIVNSAILFK